MPHAEPHPSPMNQELPGMTTAEYRVNLTALDRTSRSTVEASLAPLLNPDVVLCCVSRAGDTETHFEEDGYRVFSVEPENYVLDSNGIRFTSRAGEYLIHRVLLYPVH